MKSHLAEDIRIANPRFHHPTRDGLYRPIAFLFVTEHMRDDILAERALLLASLPAALHERQQRLFARYDDLRTRINRFDGDPWFEQAADTVLRFLDTGDLPRDELLRDLVLANAEFDALWRHKRGQDVAELMAALDRAARAGGAKRTAAVARVQDLVRAER